MALEIRDESVGDVLVLELKGRLDTDTSADLELAVQDLLETGARDFIINLAGVGYVSSAGLRVLLMLGKGVDGKGSLRLVGLNPTVRQVFDVAGFTQLFTILPNREAALAQKIKTTPGRQAAGKPEIAKSEPAKPEPARADAGRREPAKPEVVKPEPAAPAVSKPNAPPPDSLVVRVARALAVQANLNSGTVMPADQVSRVVQVLSRVGR